MATMTYRRLNDDGSYAFGRGKSGFLSEREAVAQAIRTRLLLFQGEWWENLEEGLPFFQNIAGVRNNDPQNIRKVALLVQERIVNTRDVISIKEEKVQFNQLTRTLELQYSVDTAYGEVLVDSNVATGQIKVEVK